MNREIQARAFVFKDSEVESVRHMGAEIPQSTTRLESLPEHFKTLTSGDSGALVSQLKNGENHYVVVQNTSPNDPIELQIETDEAVEMIRPDGSRVPAHLYGPLFILEAGNILVFAN